MLRSPFICEMAGNARHALYPAVHTYIIRADTAFCTNFW